MKKTASMICLALCAGIALQAQDKKEYPKPEPMTPGMTEFWVPQRAVVTPGDAATAGAPSDAIILFDGKDLSQWCSPKGGPAKWEVHDGVFTVVKGSGIEDIQTKVKVNHQEADAQGLILLLAGHIPVSDQQSAKTVAEVLQELLQRTGADIKINASQNAQTIEQALSSATGRTADVIMMSAAEDAKTVAQAIAACDKDAKVVAFKRFSLND
jgi:methylmalonyl-CoA mutase cobalamin-binding subunit